MVRQSDTGYVPTSHMFSESPLTAHTRGTGYSPSSWCSTLIVLSSSSYSIPVQGRMAIMLLFSSWLLRTGSLNFTEWLDPHILEYRSFCDRNETWPVSPMTIYSGVHATIPKQRHAYSIIVLRQHRATCLCWVGCHTTALEL